MKNILTIIVILLFVATLTSCSKKDKIQAVSTMFSANPFAGRSVLGTAD